MTTVWIAGHNMPGYLPEGDVAAFETRLEAMRYTVEDLRYCADNFGGGPGGDEYEEAADALEGRDAEGGDWYDTFEDGRIAYWFSSVDMTPEDAEEALRNEN